MLFGFLQGVRDGELEAIKPGAQDAG